MGLLLLPAIGGLMTGTTLFVIACFAKILLQKIKRGNLQWVLHALAAGYVVSTVAISEELQRTSFFVVSYMTGAFVSYFFLFAIVANSLNEEGMAKPRNLLLWMISISLGLQSAFLFWNIFSSLHLSEINTKYALAMFSYFVVAVLLAYCAIAIIRNQKPGLYVLVVLTGITLIDRIYFAFSYESKWFDSTQYLISTATILVLPLFIISYLYLRIEHMK